MMVNPFLNIVAQVEVTYLSGLCYQKKPSIELNEVKGRSTTVVCKAGQII